MNRDRYFIEPGPCGLTVPQLNSPHCLDSAPTQQASAAVSTSPQDSNVTTIVAIMSVSLAVVVLGGCIVYLVIGLRIMWVKKLHALLHNAIMSDIANTCGTLLCTLHRITLGTTEEQKPLKWQQHATWKWHQRVALGTFHCRVLKNMCMPAQTFPFSATYVKPMEWQISLWAIHSPYILADII